MSKPKLEEISPINESSFYMIHQKEPTKRCLDFWHFHPEIELVYIPKGKGNRYIGSTISHFTNGDLLMLGPNIPHNTFYYGRKSEEDEQYIIQIKEQKLLEIAKNFKEFQEIKVLLKEIQTGICIEHNSKHLIGNLITQMIELKPFSKLLHLFQILEEIKNSQHKINIGADKLLGLSQINSKRIQRVFDIIKNEYPESLTTRRLASELYMTESSFCRFFMKATGKTFKRTLNEFRIHRACNLLITTSLKINVIASHTGFNSIPLFYKFFRNLVGSTPSEYRKIQSEYINGI